MRILSFGRTINVFSDAVVGVGRRHRLAAYLGLIFVFVCALPFVMSDWLHTVDGGLRMLARQMPP